MADYVQDPNDSKKQVPGTPPDNYYDRISTAAPYSMSKTPNYVLVADDFTHTAGFNFGSSASYAKDVIASGQTAARSKVLSASAYYSNWGGNAALNAGDRLDIHPIAWSGSLVDKDKIVFVYKGGLDGSGRY